MALELCEPYTARDLVVQCMTTARQRLKTQQALEWLLQLASALAHLHAQKPPIIHRDVKLENVLLKREPNGQLICKLSDLGLHVEVADDRSAMLRRSRRLLQAYSNEASGGSRDGGSGAAAGNHGGGAGYFAGRGRSATVGVCDAGVRAGAGTKPSGVVLGGGVEQRPRSAVVWGSGKAVDDDTVSPFFAVSPGRSFSLVRRAINMASRGMRDGFQQPRPLPAHKLRVQSDITSRRVDGDQGDRREVTATCSAAVRGKGGGGGELAGRANSRPQLLLLLQVPDGTAPDRKDRPGPSPSTGRSPTDAAAGALILNSPDTIREQVRAAGQTTAPHPSHPVVGGGATRLDASATPEQSQADSSTHGPGHEVPPSVDPLAAATAKDTAAALRQLPASPFAIASGTAGDDPLMSSESCVAAAVAAAPPLATIHADSGWLEAGSRKVASELGGGGSLGAAMVGQPALTGAPSCGVSLAEDKAAEGALSAYPGAPTSPGAGSATLSALITRHPDLVEPVHGANLAGGLRQVGSLLKQLGLDELKPLKRNEMEWVYGLTGKAGSFMYMAPEVFMNEPYNEKSDVFSFGVMAYELLACEQLIISVFNTQRAAKLRVKDPQGYAAKVADGHRPPRLQKLPDSAWALIEACWHQDPVERPSMEAVVQELQRLVDQGRHQRQHKKKGGRGLSRTGSGSSATGMAVGGEGAPAGGSASGAPNDSNGEGVAASGCARCVIC